MKERKKKEVPWPDRHVQENVAFEGVTGEEIDIEDVKEARQEEMSWLNHEGTEVYKKVCRSELVAARWIGKINKRRIQILSGVKALPSERWFIEQGGSVRWNIASGSIALAAEWTCDL